MPDRCDAKLLQRFSMAAEAHIAWRRHRIAGTEADQTERPFARRRRLESQVLESLDGTRKDTGFLPISFWGLYAVAHDLGDRGFVVRAAVGCVSV